MAGRTGLGEQSKEKTGGASSRRTGETGTSSAGTRGREALREKLVLAAAFVRRRGLAVGTAFFAAFFAAASPEALLLSGGVTLAAGAGEDLLLPAVCGAAAGGLVWRRGALAARDVGACFILLLLRLALRLLELSSRVWAKPLAAFFAVFPAGLASALGTGGGASSALFVLATSALTMLSTPVVSRAWTLFSSQKAPARPADGLSLLFSLFLPLSSLTRLTFGGFSPAVPVSMALTLV